MKKKFFHIFINFFWAFLIIILVLVCGSGLFSGLTVGYLSIDDLILELRSKNGTDEEKEYAEKVLPILAKRHWLLVTLLLMNVVCMEANFMLTTPFFQSKKRFL